MSAGKGVVFALQWSREWTDAVQFAVGAEVVPAPRQYLVAVSLVSYIPNNSVVWCVVNVMQGYGYLHDTQRGGKMTRVYCHLVNDVFS